MLGSNIIDKKSNIIDKSQFYLSYLNTLVDKQNNTSHCSTSKKPIDADYDTLNEEIKTNTTAPKFKVDGKVRITKYKFQQRLH